MNTKIKEALKELQETLSSLSKQLDYVKNKLKKRHSEEEEYLDNMPENLQGSECYYQAVEYYNAMDNAVSELEDALTSVETAIDYLKEITGE